MRGGARLKEAVFAAADEQTVRRAPVESEHNAFMRGPRHRARLRVQWLDGDLAPAAVRDGLTVGAPGQAVDGRISLGRLIRQSRSGASEQGKHARGARRRNWAAYHGNGAAEEVRARGRATLLELHCACCMHNLSMRAAGEHRNKL